MANNTLPKYLLATNPNSDFEPVVIQTDYPNIVGYPIQVGKDNIESVEHFNHESANGRVAKCLGHTVYMSLKTTLSGDPVGSEEKERILREMAEYFTEVRLLKKPAMYRCCCENPKEIPSKEVRDYYQAKRQAYLRHRKEREGR